MSTEGNEPAQLPEQAGGLDVIGNRLATARRQQQLDVGSVASRLHLSVKMVNALETGDESVLPAMTFIRGYIKTYARLLGLDEKQVLALLPAGEGSRPAPLKTVGIRRPRRRQPVGKWMLWLIAMVVTALVVVYGAPLVERLWERATGQEVADSRNALPLPSDEEPVGGNALFPSLPEPLEAEIDAGIEESEDVPLPPDSEPADADDEGADSEVAVADEEVADSDVAETEVATSEVAASEASPADAPGHSDTAAAAEASDPALITLRFTQDSWVEMESHGRKLVVGTQTAGSERSVRANPPVQILLGNAPGVEIEYRGKAVNLKPYRRGKVARLVLED